MIEVEAPDGTIIEFPEGTDDATIEQVMRDNFGGPDAMVGQMLSDAQGNPLMMQPPRADAPMEAEQPYQPTAASILGQAGAGSQTGIASALGFPVDAVASAMGIQDPVGGSASIESALAPFRSGIGEPQVASERMARRVGQEVGASAAMAPLAMAAPVIRAAPGAFAVTEGASALGAGIGAGVANEIAPGSAVADVVGALAGGLPAGALASRAMGVGAVPAEMRGGVDEQRAIARDAYAPVRADPTVIRSDSVDDLALGIAGRMDAEKMNPRLHPRAAAAVDAILNDTGALMRIEDIEQSRRFIQRNVSASMDPEEKRLGQIMVEQIDDYLEGLKPADMTNRSDPSSVVQALGEGRAATRRYKAAETVEVAGTKAARRAASTGSGGNEINAIRQNLRAILDNPKKARGFRPEELAAMERVVMGTPAGNVARRLSRFSPTSGGLSAMMHLGGAAAAPAVVLPISAATEGARFFGERATRQSVDELIDLLAPSRTLSPGDPGISPIIQALLAARTSAQGGN